MMKFIKSAVHPNDYPIANMAEVAIAGRSNAGKSSFINALAKNKIAKVSQVPGKTRLLNFFNVDEKYRIVDMPGYGFATRSGDEMVSWRSMVEDYLTCRSNLIGLVLIMDIRRDWEEDEEMLRRFCFDNHLPMLVVLSKVDKCNQKEKAERLRTLKKQSQIDALFPVSSIQKLGIKEAEEYLYKNWVENAEVIHPEDEEQT